MEKYVDPSDWHSLDVASREKLLSERMSEWRAVKSRSYTALWHFLVCLFVLLAFVVVVALHLVSLHRSAPSVGVPLWAKASTVVGTLLTVVLLVRYVRLSFRAERLYWWLVYRGQSPSLKTFI